MKTRNILIALSILAAACGCTKNEQLEQPQATGDLVTITATLPDDADVKGGSLKTILSWTWNAGDKLTVIGETTEIFTIKPGFTDKKAEFEGFAVKGSKFTILYPGESALETDWNTQVQKGNNNMDHLKYEAALKDVDDYTTFAFNSDWAQAHGGTLQQTGVLKFTIPLPVEITKPDTLIMSSDDAVFFATNGEEATKSVKMAFQDCTPEDSVLVAWMTTSWNEVTVPTGASIYINVIGNYKSMSRDVLLSKDAFLKTGFVNTFSFTGKTGWSDEAVNAHYAGGKGTKVSPWIVQTADQLRCIAGDLADGTFRYYKLDADIDLTGGPEWVPLNNADTFGKGIEFDGNGKTIKGLTVTSDVPYPSFAGVLYGSIKDVTFEGAVIEGNANNAGVVAGYIGTSGKVGNCSGVTVKDATVSGSGSNVGGFAGVVGANGTISDCHVTGTTVSQTATATGKTAAGFAGNISAAAKFSGCTVKADVSNPSSYYTAGFIGQIGSAVAVSFENCAYLGGNITAGRNSTGNSPVAGFIGRLAKNTNASFTNCYVDGAIITATKSGRVGGFVGDAGDKNNMFTNCHVSNSTLSGAQHLGGFVGTYASASKCYVETTTLNSNNANTGGFAGYPENSVFSDCYVASSVTVNGGSFNAVGGFMGICKAGATITTCFTAASVSGTGTGVGAFIGNVDAAPASITKCIGWNATLEFYGAVKSGVSTEKIASNYAGTEGSISSQATTLGWSTDIWDLSGDTPKFK